MTADHLQKKRDELLTRKAELEQAFIRLETQRTQIIADTNAVSGALQLIEELLKHSDASHSS